jgi:hypothetical protein
MTIHRLILVLMCLLLTSCASQRPPSTRYSSNNPEVNFQLENATVSFKRARMLSIKIPLAPGTAFTESERAAARQVAMARLQPLLNSVETNLPIKLAAALPARGVAAGDGALISISALEASAPAGEVAQVAVEMIVESADKRKPPWIVTIIDGSESYSAEKNAAIFTERLLRELSKGGFLPK